MTTLGKAAATRSNLLRLRHRLAQVERGASLLRRKRESLVSELFERARPAVDSRRAIEEQALVAYRALLEALATTGQRDLRALGWPAREVTIEVEPHEAWGIRGVALAARPMLVRGFAARGIAAGPGDSTASEAARQFEIFLEQLLAAAPEEMFIRRLADALRHVTRLVNTLEQRVSVSLDRDVVGMQRTLEEREREEHLRLKHVVARRKARRAGT
jgi:V/A-type H+-transporting ATPase subunit D